MANIALTVLLAAQIFVQNSGAEDKVLIVYSDMRHSAPNLNLELRNVVPSFSLVNNGGTLPVADLTAAQVFVRGVDGAGKTITYWKSLRQFWIGYFKRAKAVLRSYSVLREVSPLPNTPASSAPFSPLGENTGFQRDAPALPLDYGEARRKFREHLQLSFTKPWVLP
jgi:hypothetical protein